MAATIILTITISLFYFMCILAIWRAIDLHGIIGNRLIIPTKIVVTIFCSLIVTYCFLNINAIQADNWVIISTYVGLVLITALYAISAYRQSVSTREQANASIKMVKEMRDQRIITSRPIVIQKAVTFEVTPSIDYSSYFEIYNAGNGTAIEVETSLVLQRKPPYSPINGQREGFLRAGDTPVSFHTNFPKEIINNTFYIVSEYQSVSTSTSIPTWYQTWIPCKLSVNGKVICGKLEFDEVSIEKRIGLFSNDFDKKE